MSIGRKVNHNPLYAHRISWELNRGPIPNGKHVLHRCDNPACVNPDHLFLGTQQDNNADRDQKGRTASGDENGARTKPWRNSFVRDRGSGLRGEQHPQAQLTVSEVNEIRQKFKRGDNRKDLAVEYGVSETHIYRIARQKCWRVVADLKGDE